MEKIKRLSFVNADGQPYDNPELINKINEILDWTDRHEIITAKDRDWLLGKLEEVEKGKGS